MLIGGQACIIYGAAEFSRDTDIIILCNNDNLNTLRKTLSELKAAQIFFPPLELKYLKKGHACHFRCHAKGVENLRIDIIGKLRGCSNFETMWKRRTTAALSNGLKIDILGIPDLVKCKKTQRDKDWFMLNRLVGNDILLNQPNASEDKIKWWFLECRSTETLFNLMQKFPGYIDNCIKERPLLKYVKENNKKTLEKMLYEEEVSERNKDEQYWAPLKKELSNLRRKIK